MRYVRQNHVKGVLSAADHTLNLQSRTGNKGLGPPTRGGVTTPPSKLRNVTQILRLVSWNKLAKVRADMSKPALIRPPPPPTARVHTTKSTIKILATNTHCKYFLKIAKVTSVRGTSCIRGLYNPF
jgi:hypothetical protein